MIDWCSGVEKGDFYSVTNLSDDTEQFAWLTINQFPGGPRVHTTLWKQFLNRKHGTIHWTMQEPSVIECLLPEIGLSNFQPFFYLVLTINQQGRYRWENGLTSNTQVRGVRSSGTGSLCLFHHAASILGVYGWVWDRVIAHPTPTHPSWGPWG